MAPSKPAKVTEQAPRPFQSLGARETAARQSRLHSQQLHPQKFSSTIGTRSKYAVDATSAGEDAFLQEELGDLGSDASYYNIPIDAFINTMFRFGVEGYPPPPPAELYEMADDPVYILRLNALVQAAADPTDSGVRNAFTSLVQHILSDCRNDPEMISHIASRITEAPVSYQNVVAYRDTSHAPLGGATGNAQRKPDAVLFHRDYGGRISDAPEWSHVMVPFQFRRYDRNSFASLSVFPPEPSAISRLAARIGHTVIDSRRPTGALPSSGQVSEPQKSSTPVQLSIRNGDISSEGTLVELTDRQRLGSFALEMMSVFGDRRHVLGVYIDGLMVEVWYFDRSGALGTKAFNIAQDRKTFISLIYGLARGNPQELGYEPIILPIPKPRSLLPLGTMGTSIRIGPGELKEDAPAYTIAKTLFNTRGLLGRGTAVFRVLGFDNQEEYAAKLSWQLVSRGSESEVLKRLMRRLRKRLPDGEAGRLGLPDIVEAVDYVHLCSTHENNQGFRGKLHGLIANPPTHLDRVLRVILMRTLCQPLYEVTDIAAFKRAFISLVKCHYQVFFDGGVLHGDISVDNLMVRCDNQAQGILIDFDLAVDFETQHHPIRGAGFIGDRSGSTPFLALELLKDEATPLRYRHDLESFFWVLWWIAVYYDGGARNNRRPFEKWHHGTWQNMLDAKGGFFKNAPQYTSMVSDSWVELKTWLIRLTVMFRNADQSLSEHATNALLLPDDEVVPYDLDTLDGHVTYEKFLAILEA